MKFRDFSAQVQPLPVFNFPDIRKVAPGFHRRQLVDWQQRGWILALGGGYYALSEQTVDEALLYLLANKLYQPSYVSLESALAYYQVIPESVLGVTSVSARKTQSFATRWGTFQYRTLLPRYQFGYQVVTAGSLYIYKMARLEKAVLDYLYLAAQLRSVEDLAALRWNREALAGLPDSDTFQQYLAVFQKKALQRRVDLLREYLHA